MGLTHAKIGERWYHEYAGALNHPASRAQVFDTDLMLCNCPPHERTPMTIDQIQSQSAAIAHDIKRHQVLGTAALPLDEIYDHLMSVADGPDETDCEDCEVFDKNLNAVTSGLYGIMQAKTILDVTLAMSSIMVALGSGGVDATQEASDIIAKIRSL